MDLSCIISSGDLELYVMGMLSSEDAYKIEQLAKLFPEIQAELEEIETALINASNQADAAPSEAVKDNLFARLQQLPPITAGTSTATAVTQDENMIPPATLEEHTAKVVPMYKPKRTNSWVAAAVVASIVAIGGIAFAIFSSRQHNEQMALMNTRIDSLQQYTMAQQDRLNDYNRSLSYYQDTSFKTINLASVPGKPNANVHVFWNRHNKDVYAANVSLPNAPAGKQYQLWAIVNGQPVSAGLLTDQKQIALQMSKFEQADAFAITLEKAGGSPTPTLDEMYVFGKTS